MTVDPKYLTEKQFRYELRPPWVEARLPAAVSAVHQVSPLRIAIANDFVAIYPGVPHG